MVCIQKIALQCVRQVLNVYKQKTPLHGGAYWLYKD